MGGVNIRKITLCIRGLVLALGLGSLPIVWGQDYQVITGATDIWIFWVLCIGLVVSGILSVLIHPLVGLIGGAVGGILTFQIQNVGYLIVNTAFDQTAQAYIQQVIPVGNYIFIPIFLTLGNFLSILVSRH